MTPTPQPQDPALFEVICAKEWFEKYGAQAMKGYFEARISAYNRIEKEKSRSRPAPSRAEQCNAESFRAIVEQNRAEAAAQARNAVLDEIERQTNSIFCPPFAVSCPFDKVIRSLRTKEQP